MEMYNLFHIAFLSSSFLLCITCLLFTFIQKRTDKKHNRIYIAMVAILLISSLCELSLCFAKLAGLSADTILMIDKVARYVYFLLHSALSALFYNYVTKVCGALFGSNPFSRAMYLIGFVLPEMLILTNPFTYWVYYRDENGAFQRNWAEMLIYVAGAFFIIMSVVKLFRSWDALTDKKRIALIYFLFLVGLGITIQLAHSEIKVEVFSEAMGMVGLMLCVESEDDRIDIDTGFYNRKALRQDIKSFIINKRKLFLIGVRIIDSDIFIRSAGTENADILNETISDYLRTLVPRYHIYYVNQSTYALTVYGDDENMIREFAEKISSRFDETWQFRESQIKLSAVILAAGVPGRISSVNDAFYMLDSSLPETNDKKVLVGSDLEYLLRRSAVEDAVSRGLDEHSFEVYYQPTYRMSDRKLHGAEALIRMHDKELGQISPDEFIPVAEQMGLIDRIDGFVLSEVCRFIKSGIPQQNHMECINVNLSVIECLKPGFAEKINRIVENAGIDKKFLNFEITESVAATDYDVLSEIVTALKNEGFLFSMDDYGTGYSNIAAILSLNLDVIKIDKSLLRVAQTSEYGYIMLENSIRMFKQMNRQILVEGVETDEQVELLCGFDVDYLQGYYFSKPLSESSFTEFISRSEK